MTPDRRFIEFVHANRSAIGMVLLGLAIGCVAVAAYCGYRGLGDSFRSQEPVATEPALKTEGETAPRELEPAPYQMGLAAALVAALGFGGVGAFFLGKLPPADPDERRRTDRVLILIAGYVFGLANRMSGLFLFILWFTKLTDWVNGVAGSQKTGWLPVAALLQYLIGAGITFLATVPARAEERNWAWIRRAVYAVNFALTTVLLVVGLVLVNAVVAMKMPDKLDTTSSGFYTLTEQTKGYLSGLKQKVKVYAITSEVADSRLQRWQSDALRLLASCREVNPGRFEVEELSSVSDRKKIEDLQQQYPAANLRAFGVLITAGDKFERSEYVEFERMAGRVGEDKVGFVGEAKLVRGLMFLTEQKATAYFTQASREPYLDPPADPTAAAAGRSAARLRELLEASQCAVKPWAVDPLADPSKVEVPKDADLVVVLDPLTALPPATVAALQRFMAPSDPKAKKGRLLVFAPARADEGGLLRTGLEPLLAGYGITPVDRAVYTRPNDTLTADVVNLGPISTELKQRNPLAVAVAAGLRTRNVRVVEPAGQGGRGPVGTARTAVITTDTRLVWLEGKTYTPPKAAWDALEAAVQKEDGRYVDGRMAGRGTPWSVGVYATDTEGKPAAAVFGFADGLTDDTADADGGRTAVLFAASVSWLRERPPEPDITPKEYVEYLPKKGVSEHMLFTVPVFGTLLVIVLLGLGVWAVRRK